MLRQSPSGNGVLPFTNGASALKCGQLVKISTEALVVAASGNRALGVVLEDADAAATNVPVAVSGAFQGTVKLKTSAAVTATGALLYVGATSGSVTPTDPGSGYAVAKSVGTCASGDFVEAILLG